MEQKLKNPVTTAKLSPNYGFIGIVAMLSLLISVLAIEPAFVGEAETATRTQVDAKPINVSYEETDGVTHDDPNGVYLMF